MALLLVQKQVHGVRKSYNGKPEEPAEKEAATKNAASKDWMKCHCLPDWPSCWAESQGSKLDTQL